MDTKEIGAALALLKGKAIEQVPGVVEEILEEHPDWTTTVEDGAITKAKLTSTLKEEIETNTSDVSTLKSALKEYDTGIQTFGIYGNFQHYGLDTDGSFLESQKYRVSNDDPMTFDRDLKISVANGFRWGYIPFTGTTPGSWSGWKTSDFIMPQNTSFVVQIARVTEVQSEIADVLEFLEAVTFKSMNEIRLEQVEETAELVNGEEDSLTPTYVDGLNFAANAVKYTAGSNYETYYVPCEKNDIIIFNVINTISSQLDLRFAVSSDIPSADVAGTYIGAKVLPGKQTGKYSFVAPITGYFGLANWKNNATVNVSKVDNGLVYRISTAENNISELGARTTAIEGALAKYDELPERMTSIDGIITPSLSDYEIGFIWPSGNGWSYESSSKCVRTKRGVSYSLHAGAVIGLTSYDGYKIRVGGNVSGVYSDSGWATADCNIPRDGIYCIDIAYDPEVTISDISALVDLLFIHDVSSLFATPNDVNAIKQQVKLVNETGQANLKLYGTFNHYGLDQNGNWLGSQKYRVSNMDKIQLNRDITVTVKAGFRWGYCSFPNDTATWNGWYQPGSKIVIPAGTQINFQIARINENPSEIADVDEFVSAVEFHSYLNDVLKVEEEGTEYIGDMKPKRKYLINKITTISSTYSAPDGLAITGNTLVMLFNGGGIVLYDLATKTAIGQYLLASAADSNHANSASFSNVMGTTYPLLYVSECYGNQRCFVEDIGNSSSTLVQTISFSNSDGDYTGAYDWILDVGTNKIMTFGISGNNKLIKVFNLPSTESASVILTENDVLDEWVVDDVIGESFGTYQGNTIYGNILYLPASSPERIYAFDKTTHAMIGKINITANYVNFPELEGIAVYGESLIVSDSYKNLYRIEFT